MRASGIEAMYCVSLSSCEKNTGSRPARPIGDQRHSPYSETFAPTGPPFGGVVGCGESAGFGAYHIVGPVGGPDDAL